MATYPKNVKQFKTRRDIVDIEYAQHINDLQDEVTAIETALGTNPHVGQDAYGNEKTWASVADRLNNPVMPYIVTVDADVAKNISMNGVVFTGLTDPADYGFGSDKMTFSIPALAANPNNLAFVQASLFGDVPADVDQITLQLWLRTYTTKWGVSNVNVWQDGTQQVYWNTNLGTGTGDSVEQSQSLLLDTSNGRLPNPAGVSINTYLSNRTRVSGRQALYPAGATYPSFVYTYSFAYFLKATNFSGAQLALTFTQVIPGML